MKFTEALRLAAVDQAEHPDFSCNSLFHVTYPVLGWEEYSVYRKKYERYLENGKEINGSMFCGEDYSSFQRSVARSLMLLLVAEAEETKGE